MKQLGLGFAQYSQDYDETYPMAENYPCNWSGDCPQAWDQAIQPYVGVGKISWGEKSALFLCPSDMSNYKWGESVGKRSYAVPWNWRPPADSPMQFFGGENVNWQYTRGRAVAEITDPAGTLMVVENPHEDNFFGNNNGATTDCPVWQAWEMPEKRPYHSGGWNNVFADGHAKWMKPEMTIDGNKGDGVNGTMDVGDDHSPRGMWTILPND